MFCNKTLPAQKKFGKFCGALGAQFVRFGGARRALRRALLFCSSLGKRWREAGSGAVSARSGQPYRSGNAGNASVGKSQEVKGFDVYHTNSGK